MDLEDGYAALGFAKGLSEGFTSKYYLTSVVEYAFGAMSEAFNDEVMLAAESNAGSLQHVYEPGYEGDPHARLWTNILAGRGEKRQATFEFRNSVMPILNPRERKSDPSDPMSEVPDEIIDKLSMEPYVFRLRAPIMEYGIRTTITPRPGKKRLFIPTFGLHYPYKRRGKGNGGPQNFRFEKINVPDWSFSNPQEPSGSQGSVGRFTGQWVAFWAGGGADALWKNTIMKGIEGDLDDWGAKMGKIVKSKKSSSKVAQISTFNDSKAAFENGRNLAQAYMKGKARTYAAASRYVEKHGAFGGDIVH